MSSSSLSQAPELRFPGAIQFVALIERAKTSGVGRHVGVLVDSIFGQVVYDRSPKEGLRRVPVDEFGAGKALRVRRTVNDRESVEVAVARLGKVCSDQRELQYDPIVRNCEHFANQVVAGESKSETLWGVVAVLAGVSLAVLLVRNAR